VSYSHDLFHRFQQKPFRFRACARWRLTFFSTDVAEALTGVSNREVVYPPPEHQDRKIAAIRTAAPHLEAALNPPQRPSAPSDKDVVEAIRTTAADLSMAAGSATGPGADAARHVSELLTRLARSDAAMRSKVEAAVIPSLV
jgi:hypothetical protein